MCCKKLIFIFKFSAIASNYDRKQKMKISENVVKELNVMFLLNCKLRLLAFHPICYFCYQKVGTSIGNADQLR